MKHVVVLILALASSTPAGGAELTYAVTNLLSREGLEAARGLELGVRAGGEHGDRWSVWLGAVNARSTSTGFLCHDGGNGRNCYQISGFRPHRYVAVNHRWYVRRDNVKAYAGTGVGYRDQETCVDPPQFFIEFGERTRCVDGDLSVSSRWAFSSELGVVWREHLEFSFGHFSTGGISEWNRGDNFFKFGFVATPGGKR